MTKAPMDADSTRWSRKAIPSLEAAMLAWSDIFILVEPLVLRLWGEGGLTMLQVRVLRIVGIAPIGHRQLAAALEVTPPSLTRILARLQELGLIERTVDPVDRRRQLISITQQGREAFLANRLLRGTAFDRALAAMSEEDRQLLVRVLSDFRDRVKAAGGVKTAGGAIVQPPSLLPSIAASLRRRRSRNGVGVAPDHRTP